MTWMLQTWHGLDLQSTVRSMQVNAKNSSRYARIDPLDCILTYNDLLGNHSDFIMVSTATSKSKNSLLAYGMSVADTWDIGYNLCSQGEQFDCGRLASLPLDEQLKAIQDWNIGGYKIDYCLSSRRSTENLCSVEYSFSIMLSTLLSLVEYTPPTPKNALTNVGCQSCAYSISLNAFSYFILYSTTQAPRIVHSVTLVTRYAPSCKTQINRRKG